MSNLSRLAVGFVMGFVILAAMSFYLPATINVTREIEIDASEQEIFPFIADLRNFNRWSPWASIDPKTNYVFSGPESGEGAQMAWQSNDPNVGNGTMTITGAQPPASVEVELDFGEYGTGTSYFRLAPIRTGTRVNWRFNTNVGNNPIRRWAGLLLESAIGKKYEQGLGQLKTLVEKRH